ncbi:hypothetical protein [Thermococcus sp.]|uniref:hypothetical protein n=1 Tax=Thermococcus sp. TaxID=35749 RepID=UPI00261BFAA2|nr:hypothetical protein [Thermococcus sp.]
MSFVYQTAPGLYSEFRNYAPDDCFYVFDREGTVKKFDLGRSFLPLMNAFLVSNGSYVLMGFERPLPDGSPMSGYVMILNGTEVAWSRPFQMNDPSCLCPVIPGWGRIDKTAVRPLACTRVIPLLQRDADVSPCRAMSLIL